MNFSYISKMILPLTLVLCLYRAGVFGDYGSATPTTDIAEYKEIKGCSLEAVYYAATFLASKCRYVNPLSCFESFGKCMDTKGFNATAAVSQCAQELNRSFQEVATQSCDITPPAYLLSLQASCCSKTKLVEQSNGKSFYEVESIVETCYDKDKCGNQSCP